MARKAGSKGNLTAKAIADAATALFAEHGYAAVSMRRIAARVGVQAGALYNHFPTKQDVLASVLTGHMAALLEAFEALPALTAGPVAALEGFARFHVRYHLTRKSDVFIAFMELRSLEPENFRAVAALRQRYEYRVRDILASGRSAGLFRIEDDHLSAMALLAMLTGVTNWYRPDGRLSVAEIEEIYVGLTRRAVGLDIIHDQALRKAF
ncbi:MAG: TetR/AcrR family transcriptional regulator [Rhizobiales bacterium]|nr:TetR/AcrR family transcriptional regulator [Hyphomicrobiales bacterium]